GINDFPVSAKQQFFHLNRRLLGVPPRPVSVLFGWKVGFKDRFQHQRCRRHADPIPHGRDTQGPGCWFCRTPSLGCIATRSSPSPPDTAFLLSIPSATLPRPVGWCHTASRSKTCSG